MSLHSSDARETVDRARLRDAMAGETDVLLVVLFGSRVTDRSGDESDVDLGILFDGYDPSRKYETIRRMLCSLWGSAPSRLVDLVVLNDAGPLLRHRVAGSGVALYERRPGEMVRFTIKAVREYQDMAYHRAIFLKQRIRKLKGGLRDGGPGDLLAQARSLGRLFDEDQGL